MRLDQQSRDLGGCRCIDQFIKLSSFWTEKEGIFPGL